MIGVTALGGYAAAQDYLDCSLHGCPCGYLGDPVRECRCAGSAIARYQKRISGPLLDRIDIHLEVPRVDYDKLSDKRTSEPSATDRDRMNAAARARQTERLTDIDQVGPAQTAEARQYRPRQSAS